MPADWEQMMHGALEAHIARTSDYHLSVFGSGDAWHWSVRYRRRGRVEGRETTLATAKAAAEDAVRRLAAIQGRGTQDSGG